MPFFEARLIRAPQTGSRFLRLAACQGPHQPYFSPGAAKSSQEPQWNPESQPASQRARHQPARFSCTLPQNDLTQSSRTKEKLTNGTRKTPTFHSATGLGRYICVYINIHIYVYIYIYSLTKRSFTGFLLKF